MSASSFGLNGYFSSMRKSDIFKSRFLRAFYIQLQKYLLLYLFSFAFRVFGGFTRANFRRNECLWRSNLPLKLVFALQESNLDMELTSDKRDPVKLLSA